MDDTRTRRAVVAGLTAVLAGCATGSSDESDDGGDSDGTTSTTSAVPVLGDAEQLGDLRLTSPAFDDGGTIPEKYGRKAQDVNPPLEVSNVPDDARSLVLVVDDPDAVEPAGKVWLHWLVWNVPPDRTTIPEDWTPATAIQGTNDFGERGYGGPAPPDGPHTYRFKCYALDTTLDLPASAGKREVGEAMHEHVLARTQLEGTYAP